MHSSNTVGKCRSHFWMIQTPATLRRGLKKSYKPPNIQDAKNLAIAPQNLDHPVLSLLSKCQTMAHFNQTHCLMITTGLSRDAFPASRLLVASSFSLSPPNIHLAYVVFSQIQSPDVYSYNIMIKAFSQTSHPLDSLHFYHKLLHQGLYPNEYTFCFVLTSCAQALALQEGKQIQAQLIKHLSLGSVYAST